MGKRLERSYFNPRPREEGDVLLDDVEQGVDEISIHALVKRATYRVSYQDPALHISIHALVKRATYRVSYQDPALHISIHALVKRATIALISVSLSYIYFNPRPREEGDTTI